MAVQAQHNLSNAFFSPDSRNTTNARMNVLDMLPMQQHLAGTVFSGPQSDLTYCNDASGSRKRGREQQEPPVAVVDMNVSSMHNLPVQFRYEQQPARAVDSTETSTSGGGPVLSPLAADLYSHVHRHNVEIDSIIKLQSERLRFVLEESRKRQCRSLVSVLENRLVKRLKEKEAELEMANRKNAELEEKIRQLSSENEVWFNVAKNNEAIVSSLQQLLLQNALRADAAAAPPAADVKEGYGDSDGGTDDAQSCCFEGVGAAGGTRRLCRVCSRNDVGVLLLPCRHLCVCKDCESKVDTCPICSGSKNASLHIFMS